MQRHSVQRDEYHFFFPNGMSINTLDREVIEVMKEAGCVEIRLPIESGSEHLRNKIMKKGLSNKKIFEVIEACNDLNLPTVGYFIVGMPGEDHKTMQENVDFVKQLKGGSYFIPKVPLMRLIYGQLSMPYTSVMTVLFIT